MTSRYTALRGELERLRDCFRHEGVTRSGLLAQRYWDAGRMAPEGWAAFASRVARADCWEEWHLLADGEGLICLHGDCTALDAFARLADSGWLALVALEQAPAPGAITLGDGGHMCGWLTAVFETALAAMTSGGAGRRRGGEPE